MVRINEVARRLPYHRQSDGQTETVNKSLEHYLRSSASDRPTEWVDWLPLAEYWFNTDYHSSAKTTPFEAVYGFPPPRLCDYIPGTTNLEAVDSFLQSRDQILALFKQNLVDAQARMMEQPDKHKSDWVCVRKVIGFVLGYSHSSRSLWGFSSIGVYSSQ